jgi:hypothetical protein
MVCLYRRPKTKTATTRIDDAYRDIDWSSSMFSFDNFAMTIVIALIVISWLSFFSVIFSG